MSLRSRLSSAFGWIFNYANNGLTITGIVFATGSGLTILVFVIEQMRGALRNPYINIFAYMILPAVLVAALVLIPLGMWRRRRALIAAGITERERGRYPRLDFNDPHLRRVASIVLLLTGANALIFGVSSYYAVEELESTEFCGSSCHLMQPELTAYEESPHSRVACVECHIGPGASWFVRSKLDGLRQVWKTAFNTFDRPIATPVHALRPARETCEACHWPEKNYGDRLRLFARFATDEENTPSYSAFTLKTGGGRQEVGDHGGIHWWHIYSDNRIRYFATDERREEIGWVELLTPDGDLRVYTREGEELPPTEEIEAGARIMDCIDCHNRPTHLFQVPTKALDHLLASNHGLADLPYFKREAVAAIEEGEYETREEGMEAIRERMLAFYQQEYSDLWQARQELVERGAEVAASVYGKSSFPEMNTNWETHPNHIGHDDFPGCWRCHDEELATEDGEHVISIDCDICHTFLLEDSPTPPDFDLLAFSSQTARLVK